MPLKPREYQLEAIAAQEEFWTRKRRGATVLPTGMGKTVVFAHLSIKHLAKRPLILVHRDELIKQAARKIHSIAPELSVGIIKGQKFNQIGRDITIASIQTLSRKVKVQQPNGEFAMIPRRLFSLSPDMFKLIVIDEAHHAAADSYKMVVEYFGGFLPDDDLEKGALVAGYSATLVRNDSKGLGDVWQEIVYRKDILWGINRGFLCDVRGKRVVVEGLDLSRIRKTGSDFSEGALGTALHEAGIGKAVYDAYVEHGGSRQAVAFLPTVDTAHEVTEYLHSRGIRSACVTGSTTEQDRDFIYKMVEAKEIDVLVNCMVLTEGFDIAQLEVAIIARPTQSEGLYVQMVGRILRIFPGKTEALVLDLVGATEDNRLASLADLSETIVQTPKDGESLKEASERETEDIEESAQTVGNIVSVHDIELFASRSSAWMRTFRGYWFIPSGQRIYAVLPETTDEKEFTVGYFWSGMGAKDSSGKIVEHVTLEYGMAWAESEAESHEPMTARKGASWRKKLREPATAPQIGLAHRVGVRNPEGMTKVELSDAISVVLASNRIDKWEPENV